MRSDRVDASACVCAERLLSLVGAGHADFVESLWPTAEELLPLPSLRLSTATSPSAFAFDGGPLGDAGCGLTDDDFAAVLFGTSPCATMQGEQARRQEGTSRPPPAGPKGKRQQQARPPLRTSHSSSSLDNKPVTPEKRHERLTQVRARAAWA